MSKVSVIIPLYEVEKYIASTVKSVLAQTYTDLELLIVDDGSPDKSLEICQQFIDPRIKVIYQENQGVAEARNNGIRHAQGEYITFLDGDDLWLPEKLEKHIEHLENSPTVGISFSRSAFIDEVGNHLESYQMPKLKDITPQYLLRCNPVGNGSSAVIRRSCFEAIKYQDNLCGNMPTSACLSELSPDQVGVCMQDFYFDPQFQRSEDIECWLRIVIQTSWQIEGIPEALTLYRVNSRGLSANLIKQYESWKMLLNKLHSYAPKLTARWEKQAKAYQLQYLASRAVRLKAGPIAVEFINRALANYWRILLEEPRRMLVTGAAAYLLLLLPQSLYWQIEKFALKISNAKQRHRIYQDLSKESV